VIDPFAAAGTLRDAYRRVDWAATPLGPAESWSPALLGSLDLLLNTRNPGTLLWGPDFLLVYNEAYVPMIGDKHPAALGAPAAEVFAEIWDTIGPMLASAAAGAGATWVEDLKLLMDRRGFLEETYFTFSYSAVRDPDGAIEGVIDLASETTMQVLGHRRLELLSRLNDRLADVGDLRQMLDLAMPVLRSDPDDLPGVDILITDGEALGAEAVLPVEPSAVEQAMTLTTTRSGREARIRLTDHAVLVTGLSPHLSEDEAYLGFLRLIGAALMQGLNRIQVRQVERRAATMERQLSESLQRSLLTPAVRPELLRIAVRYQPAAEGARIGGDWYDAFRLVDGRLTVVVGDVTGHDRHAAAGMSQIRNLLRGISYALREPPALVLSALNEAMTGFGVNVFATVILAQIDEHTNELRWANAGHPPPMLLGPDGAVRLLEARAEPMLGTRFGGRRTDQEVTLTPGSAIVLYTDGLIERRHSSLDDGLRDLAGALRGQAHLSAEELCDHLLARFGTGGEDDIVLAVVRADTEA
jgi:serine phosphatase RsbU (regulator of sigma subunit)